MKKIIWIAAAAGVFALNARVQAHEGELSSVAMMVSAAGQFLASLGEDQRAKAQFGFDDESRLDWHFIPKTDRKGPNFEDLSVAQSLLAYRLISAGLSRAGYAKALDIMSLEQVLREIETKSGNARMVSMRNPADYHFSIFGDPSGESPWGWSVEGHHLSLNFTIVAGRVVATTPLFMGANPHRIMEGPRQGHRALEREEDLAFDLLGALDEARRKQAVIGDEAPPELFSAALRKVEFDGPPKGLSAAKMTDDQTALLRALIEVYIGNLPEDLAKERRAKVEAAGDEIWFAWMGSTERAPGRPYYYRVQAHEFLIEFDNFQSGANHSHTVWRDYDGDFGLDLLAEHHRKYRHDGR